MLGRNELTASILISSHYLLYKEMHFNSSPITRWLLTLSIILILGDSARIILLSNEQFHTLRARNDNTNQLPLYRHGSVSSRKCTLFITSARPLSFFFREKETKAFPPRIYSIYFHQFIDSTRRFSLVIPRSSLVSGEKKWTLFLFDIWDSPRGYRSPIEGARGRGRMSIGARETIAVRPDGLCRFHLRLSFDRPTDETIIWEGHS